jgi:hypothetical protein
VLTKISVPRKEAMTEVWRKFNIAGRICTSRLILLIF